MTLLSKLRKRRGQPGARGFRANDDGVTAIEFGMIGPLFFLLLGSIMETGIMLFTEYSLQTSVQSAARLVRTGQAQELQLTAAGFKNKVCDTASIVMDCAGGVTVYMASAANFAALAASVPSYLTIGNSFGGAPGPTSYSCGSPSQAIAMIATYDWDITMPFLKQHFGNVNGGEKRRLAGLAIFQNEPFPASAKTCL